MCFIVIVNVFVVCSVGVLQRYDHYVILYKQEETTKSQQKQHQAKRLEQLEKYLARPAQNVEINALSCGKKPSP